ncbi:MAG: ATP-binding protein [Acidobacteriota bacterium]
MSRKSDAGTKKDPVGDGRDAAVRHAKTGRLHEKKSPAIKPRQCGARETTYKGKTARYAEELDPIFSTLTEPVIIYDASGTIVKANSAAIRSYGFDPTLHAKSGESIIRRINLRNDDGSPIAPADLPSSRAAAGETVINRRLFFTDSAGKDVTIEASAAPIYRRRTFAGVVVAWHDISDIIRREKEAGRYLGNMEFLSASAMFFLRQLSCDEIYRFLGEGLYDVSGNATVTVSEYIPEKDRITIREVYADKATMDRAAIILGRQPVGLSFEFGNAIRKKIDSGGLMKVEGGLYELLLRQLPLASCKRLEKELRLKVIYTMPFSYESDFLGAVAIMTPGEELPNRRLIEVFVGQAAIALKRKQAEEALKKAHDALEARVQERTLQLSRAYDRLMNEIEERKRAEAGLQKRTYDLNERVKEMNCLYSVYGIVEKRNLPIEEKLQKIVELIPPAMQYPDTACTQVLFAGRKYRSIDFRETAWKLQSEIVVSEGVAGSVEVYYRAERPREYAGPFLREEVALIDAVSKKVAEMAELARSEEEVVRYRMHLEELIRDRTAELEKMNEQLRQEVEEHARAEERKTQLVGKLEDVNRELSDFAHVISHDLKAPLRAISSLTNWIATDYSDKFDEQGREKVALLLRRVKRMHDFIEAILQYSRIGKSGEERSAVDLGELVHDVIETISPPVNVTITVGKKLPVLFCDRTKLQQVFQNLIGNAVKFMDKQGGEIRVQYVSDDAYHRFSVSDSGPGIEERHFDRIFKIFQTLTPRDEFESTGVGLALVKKIVEMYGGSIWVESVMGQGSTFTFTLPKASSDEKQ